MQTAQLTEQRRTQMQQPPPRRTQHTVLAFLPGLSAYHNIMQVLSTLSASYQFEFQASGTRYLATLAELPTQLHGLEQQVCQSLVTVITTSHARDLEDDAWLDRQIDLFRDLEHDVWNPDFLQGLLITTIDHNISMPSPGLPANIKRLSGWHTVLPALGLPVGERYLLAWVSLTRIVWPLLPLTLRTLSCQPTVR